MCHPERSFLRFHRKKRSRRTCVCTTDLIHPYQIRLRRRILRMNPFGNLGRIPLIWKLRIHSHPISRRSRELDHLGRCVPAQQVFLQLHRVGLSCKRPDLHTPPSTRICIHASRRGERLHLHLRHPCAIHSRRLCRSQREIDNPSADKWPPICNLHHNRFVVGKIRYSHHRSHRQRQVRSGHRILVIHGAIGAFPPGVRRPIPARQSNLSRDGFPKTIRDQRRGGNCRRSRTRLARSRTRAVMIRSRAGRRRRRRLISPSRLPMTTTCHQRERRQHRGGDNPAGHHGFGAFFGGGGADVLRACSSIRCASLCNSAAAARRASDPFRRTSGTTSSLMYFTTFRRSVSRCAAASRNCCSHGRFGSSVAIHTPLHH